MHYLVRSCIKPSLLRLTLFRGTIIAASGIMVIIFSGTLLPLFLLRVFGFPLLLMGFTLVAIGLFPYRRLSKLELFPYEIGYTDTLFLFLRNKKLLFEIDIVNIEKIDYLEKEKLYGLGLILKKPLKDKIAIQAGKQDLAPFISSFEGYDLFLPYFTKSAHDEVEETFIS